jgi:predicted amidophosphoribosyltransferase
MPGVDYRWSCLACGSGNDPPADYCSTCGMPTDVDSVFVEGWTKSLNQKPNGPSLNLVKMAIWDEAAYLEERTAPCPKCRLHMYIWDAVCPHCQYELELFERHQLRKLFWAKFRYGVRLGLVAIGILITILCAVVVMRNGI